MHAAFVRRGVFSLLAAFALAQIAAVARAQDPDPTAEFNTRLTEWKQMLAKLRELAVKFKSTKPAERGSLDKEYKEQVARGAKMVGPLKSAAEAAYAAQPAANAEAAGLLAQFARKAAVDVDDYEEAARLAKVLTEHGYSDADLLEVAGVAACRTNDYDAAEKYLAEAQGKKKLGEDAQMCQAQLPELRKLWEKEQAVRQAEAQADDLPRVLIRTSKGDVVVELFENEAPNAVANFISLVEKKFYDGTKFHRVIGGFMAQGGDPRGDGTGGPGYTIACECGAENHRNHFRGVLSMAHAGKDTGGSQFYITFVPTTHLNGQHTVFGRVVEGMDAASKLQRTESKAGKVDGAPDKILEAKVLRKREHEYKPVTGPER